MELKFNHEAAYESKSNIIRSTGNAVNITPTLMEDADLGVPVKVSALWFTVEYQGKAHRVLASNPADAAYKLAHRHITRSKRLTVAGWSVTHEGLGLYQAYVNGSSTGNTIRVR
jgi:hypothetical protein